MMGDSAHTAYHTNPGKKSAPPLFLEDENFFQKSAPLVLCIWGIKFPLEPTEPSFEKCSHLREKGGVLMLFKTTPHLGAKAQYQQLSLGTICYIVKLVYILNQDIDQSHSKGIPKIEDIKWDLVGCTQNFVNNKIDSQYSV